jgi:hypothetical protein
MTRLGRRTRLLLRAYPAGYRCAHAEEIAGTLLEATAAGRAWPLPRESRALIMAGLRARAAANGRLGMWAGLRLAALLGYELPRRDGGVIVFPGGTLTLKLSENAAGECSHLTDPATYQAITTANGNITG